MRYDKPKKQKPRTITRPRINSEITAPELRVVGEKGENLGVMSREQALSLVRPEEGLDLIEVVPSAKPPVARLMSFDKYRYLESKKEKKERLAKRASQAELKRVQISARSAKHDLEVRLKQLEEFMQSGHPIEIQLELRGREKRNKDWARYKLEEFLKMITLDFKVTSPPKFGGRGMLMQITKK